MHTFQYRLIIRAVSGCFLLGGLGGVGARRGGRFGALGGALLVLMGRPHWPGMERLGFGAARVHGAHDHADVERVVHFEGARFGWLFLFQ